MPGTEAPEGVYAHVYVYVMPLSCSAEALYGAHPPSIANGIKKGFYFINFVSFD